MSDMAKSYLILRSKMSPAARKAAAKKMQELLTEIALREHSQDRKEAQANNQKGRGVGKGI